MDEEGFSEGKTITTFYTKKSSAIEFGGSWIVEPNDGGTSRLVRDEKLGPITYKVAVVLPEKVASFYIRYPTLAKGMAVIANKPQ